MSGTEFELSLTTVEIPVAARIELGLKICDDLNSSIATDGPESDTDAFLWDMKLSPAEGRRLNHLFVQEPRRRDSRIRGCERHWDLQDVPRSVALMRSMGRDGFSPEDWLAEDPVVSYRSGGQQRSITVWSSLGNWRAPTIGSLRSFQKILGHVEQDVQF